MRNRSGKSAKKNFRFDWSAMRPRLRVKRDSAKKCLITTMLQIVARRLRPSDALQAGTLALQSYP